MMRTGRFEEYLRSGQVYREPWAFFDGVFRYPGGSGYALRGPDSGFDMAQTYLVYLEGQAGSPVTMYGSEGTFVPYQRELPLEGLDNG